MIQTLNDMKQSLVGANGRSPLHNQMVFVRDYNNETYSIEDVYKT